MFTKKRSAQNAKSRVGWDLFYTIAVIPNDDGLSLPHQADNVLFGVSMLKTQIPVRVVLFSLVRFLLLLLLSL